MDLISVTREDELKFNIRVRGHQVSCDMSEKEGGRDQGPSPAELLAGSLGTCTAMMVQSYCKKHGYEGDVEVNLTMELADYPKRIGRIVLDLELPDGVPEDKKEAIKRVAHLCPIHQTFEHPPAIDIEIV